jgi:LysR family transcriptional regulator, regulatory protein for tcuABC
MGWHGASGLHDMNVLQKAKIPISEMGYTYFLYAPDPRNNKGRQLDLRQLKYFVQIIDSGSLAKASRQLFIAQPALSQQIARLEAEVGKPLLIRTSKGVTPTENGTALHHHARFMLRQLDQAISIARQEPGTVHGMVSVGLAATTVCAVGVPFVRKIREKYPGIVLNVVEGMSGHLAQMMQLGQLDLAILFSRDAVPDLPTEPLVEEELFVMLPSDSELVAPRRIKLSVAETAQLPLILPTGIHGLRRRIAAEFEQRNLATRVVAEIDSLSLLMACVREGMGATIKPMSAALLEGKKRQGWRTLAFSDANMKRQNYLYSVVPERLSPAAAAVRVELKETVKQLVLTGAWQGVNLLY